MNAELDIVCTENIQYAEKSFNIGTNLKNKMIFALFRFFRTGLFDAIKKLRVYQLKNVSIASRDDRKLYSRQFQYPSPALNQPPAYEVSAWHKSVSILKKTFSKN